MPKVHHVKKARKDHPPNIKKGESYYWWKFNFGPKVKSKTRPKRSQLTQSPFYATLWDLEDNMAARFAGIETADDLQSAVEDLISEITEMEDELQNNLDNMPEHLQDTSDSGMMITERIDGMSQWSSDIESVLLPDEDDPEEIATAIEEICSLDYPG